MRKLRVLALHSFRTSAKIFREQASALDVRLSIEKKVALFCSDRLFLFIVRRGEHQTGKSASQMQIAGLEGKFDDLVELVRGLAALLTAFILAM